MPSTINSSNHFLWRGTEGWGIVVKWDKWRFWLKWRILGYVCILMHLIQWGGTEWWCMRERWELQDRCRSNVLQVIGENGMQDTRGDEQPQHSRDISHNATGRKAKHASTKAGKVAGECRNNDGMSCDQSWPSTSSNKGTAESREGKEMRHSIWVVGRGVTRSLCRMGK